MKKIRSSNNKTDQTHYTNKFVESLGQASFQIYKPEQLHETKNDTSFYSKDYKYNAHVPTGVWLTGAPLLWQQGYTGKGCTVGVIDSGIDPNHNDLQNVKKRFSFIGDDDYTSINNHGTHVAGIIGANGHIKGVAPDVCLHDYRILDNKGRSRYGILEKAIVRAVDDGCQVINLSLGGPYPSESIEKAVDYAKKKNVLLVVAAGNEGGYLDWEDVIVSYPAFYSSVLSVTSVDYHTGSGKITLSKTKFSNRNSEVDLCADGYRVLSTVKDNYYGVLSGTSMACPHVSGVAALAFNKAQAVTKNTGYGVYDLYTTVKSHSVPIDITSIVDTDTGADSITGFGLSTFFPEIPSRKTDKAEFCLPTLNMLSPD